MDLLDRQLSLREKPDPPAGIVQPGAQKGCRHPGTKAVHVVVGEGVPQVFPPREFPIDAVDQLFGSVAQIGAGFLRQQRNLGLRPAGVAAVQLYPHDRPLYVAAHQRA